jgi:hypothetical protein
MGRESFSHRLWPRKSSALVQSGSREPANLSLILASSSKAQR